MLKKLVTEVCPSLRDCEQRAYIDAVKFSLSSTMPNARQSDSTISHTRDGNVTEDHHQPRRSCGFARLPTIPGVTPPLVKHCTLRNEAGFAGPEGALLAVAESGVLAPVVVARQVDVLPFEG
jgi:hypothetical protein